MSEKRRLLLGPDCSPFPAQGTYKIRVAIWGDGRLRPS
jgi:hypothetical protein